ncbi:hypothetical protein FQA39_LY06133 [Lamprigera yunnana]|nr:hypothetical protein FQA39_LY06133 [Lamprigera yunnana]
MYGIIFLERIVHKRARRRAACKFSLIFDAKSVKLLPLSEWLKREDVKIEYSGDINDFANVDLNLVTSGVPNEDDTLKSLHSKHVESESSEVDEYGDVTADYVPLEQAENQVRQVRMQH